MTDTQIIHLLALTLSKEGTSLNHLYSELLKIVRDDTIKDNHIFRMAAQKLISAIQEYKRSDNAHKKNCAASFLTMMDVT